MRGDHLELGEIGFTSELLNFKHNEQDILMYYPPEYFSPNMEFDLGFDFWSLGCVLHEIFTLEKAFESVTSILNNKPVHSIDLNFGIITNMLNSNIKDRPAARSILKSLFQIKANFRLQN